MELQKVLVWGVIILLLLVSIFLLTRELICWYYKINRRIELLEQVSNALLHIAKNANATYSCRWCGLQSEVKFHFCHGCDRDTSGLVKEEYERRYSSNVASGKGEKK